MTNLMKFEKLLRCKINFSGHVVLFSSRKLPDKSANLKNSAKGPHNVSEYQTSQKIKFSPQRNRESSSQRVSQKVHPIHTDTLFSCGFMSDQGSRQANAYNNISKPDDSHANMYDRHNPVSLSSVMQSNVPSPYKMKDQKCSAHLNMPGGQWSQDDKYVSADRIEAKGITKKSKVSLTASLHYPSLYVACLEVDDFSNRRSITKSFHSASKQMQDSKKDELSTNENMTQRERLKFAVKQYGSIVILFHITISLASLGICFLLVFSGLDVNNLFGIDMLSISNENSDVILEGMNIDEGMSNKKVKEESGSVSAAVGVTTFVIAYALHKVFAPVRIGITLTAAPLIVRYLRKIGFMRPPKG